MIDGVSSAFLFLFFFRSLRSVLDGFGFWAGVHAGLTCWLGHARYSAFALLGSWFNGIGCFALFIVSYLSIRCTLVLNSSSRPVIHSSVCHTSYILMFIVVHQLLHLTKHRQHHRLLHRLDVSSGRWLWNFETSLANIILPVSVAVWEDLLIQTCLGFSNSGRSIPVDESICPARLSQEVS